MVNCGTTDYGLLEEQRDFCTDNERDNVYHYRRGDAYRHDGRQALQTDNITYVAHDYGNFEKVGYVGQSFPTADHQTSTSAGDIVLYNGDNICIFYGSNSWSYTRIGKLDNLSADEVRRFVKAGEGEVAITLSLQPIYTGIQELSPDENSEGTTYTITGQIAPKGYKGIVIQNGKKRINY